MKISKDEFISMLENKEIKSFIINGKKFYSEEKDDSKYEEAKKEFKEFLNKKPLPTFEQCLKEEMKLKRNIVL